MLLQELCEALTGTVRGELRQNEPLAVHSSFKIGGPADIFFVPEDEADLAQALRLCRQTGVPVWPMGAGSNLLVSDSGVRGLVVRIWKPLGQVCFDGERVRVGAGAPLPKLAKMAADRGLTGIEWAGGIPGTVGGGVVMNAGAHGGDMSQVVTRVWLLAADGSLHEKAADQMGFAYRHSLLAAEREWIVASAELCLASADRVSILKRMKEFAGRRKRTQPLGLPSSGSIFKNPPGGHAGHLIEQAGLKGARVGGVLVSPVHANFIINAGNATGADALALIRLIRERVADQFGVQLELEVELVGWPKA